MQENPQSQDGSFSDGTRQIKFRMTYQIILLYHPNPTFMFVTDAVKNSHLNKADRKHGNFRLEQIKFFYKNGPCVLYFYSCPSLDVKCYFNIFLVIILLELIVPSARIEKWIDARKLKWKQKMEEILSSSVSFHWEKNRVKDFGQ